MNNRHNVPVSFQLGPDRHAQLLNDDSIRILVYCTSEPWLPNSEVAFPNQIELKVNEELFQGNLRGIKKKSGTTRPADITNLVRKIPSYHNKVSITYAATDKVRQNPVA